MPIADRSYSGTFTVRTSPRVHRLASRPRSRASRRALGVFELPDDLRVLDL
ncbi:toxin-antitoxin system HicB family antitoxin, partial [Methylomonas sp. LWB]|uniref:toxin-antitoxin system HicB family antitoxin n=1 Tax=Methylomonas sp. LWB TaxID=1905845 RepID=UPI0034A3DC74